MPSLVSGAGGQAPAGMPPLGLPPSGLPPSSAGAPPPPPPILEMSSRTEDQHAARPPRPPARAPSPAADSLPQIDPRLQPQRHLLPDSRLDPKRVARRV